MASKTASNLATALTVVLTASVAHAQTTDAQLAQSLFERGRALMASGQYHEACPILAESQRLDPGGGTLMNLALCHESEGRTATAWTELNEALSGALRDGRKDREELARQRIAALGPRLSHLTVMVPASADTAGVSVTLDGVALGRAAWGVATAVDPGSHRVVATAPGQAGSEQTVEVRGDGDSEVVTLPAASPAAPVAVPPSATPLCSAERHWDGTSCAKAKSPGKSSLRYVALAGAGAATALTVVAGIIALEDKSAMDSQCNVSRNFCSSQAGVSDGAGTVTWGWVSTASFVVAVGTAAAFVFWPDKKPVTIAPTTSGRGAGILVKAVF